MTLRAATADLPRGSGLTDDTLTGDTDLNADPDFSPGADYTGKTDLPVDSTPEREQNLAGLDDPGHVFDQTNGLVDLGGETDEMDADETSRADTPLH